MERVSSGLTLTKNTRAENIERGETLANVQVGAKFENVGWNFNQKSRLQGQILYKGILITTGQKGEPE